MSLNSGMDTPRYKELEARYAAAADEITRIDILLKMGVEIRGFEAEKASSLGDEIIQRSVAVGYELGIGRGYNLKGSCYWLQGDYDEGQKVLEQAYEIARKIRNRPLEARVLNNFGNIYRDLGDLAKALNYFEEALAINEELGDDFAQATNLTSISNLHYDLNDFDTALEYALKCKPIFERAKATSRLITVYNTLGNIYFKQDQFDEALKYFVENLKQSEPETATHVMAQSGMGKVYYKMGNEKNAEEFLNVALDRSSALNIVEVQIISEYYLGLLDMDREQYERARKRLDSAYELAKDYSRRHDLMSLHETMSELYDRMGDIPRAFHHLKSFERLKEDIFQQTTLNQLRNLQIRQQIELAQKEKEVAERTAQLKQQFMANMSHEIRTPMNAIVGMTRLLLNKQPNDEQLRYLNAIQQSADNLLVIINDILDLSKIEAGKIVIENIDFSLGEVLHSMRDMLMLKAEEKGVDFRTTVDAIIPQRLVGDPTRVSQVLVNLAGNAIKFTEKGFVEIRVKECKTEGKKHWIKFEVEDTGIGIAQDYIDRIFESFTQAGTDTARKYGGTGLGLTISKQLVDLMQGEITMKSELGKGTIFTVSIPFEEASSQVSVKQTPTATESSVSRLRRSHILLVEDNEFNRMVAEDTLHEALPGITIDAAVNGQEAVNLVRSSFYDLVLMDVQMPVMDGLTATKTIRETLAAPHNKVPIVAMTANVLQEDVQQYLAAGMNAYVSKPFQTDELIRKMAEVLHELPASAMEAMQPATNGKTLPDHVTDMHFLLRFTGGNQDKLHKYVGMFLENGPRLLKQVEEALEARDLPTLKIAAHSLKPQLSYMGVKEEISHIFLIEQTAGEQGHIDRLPELVRNLKKVCEKAFEELSIA